MKIVQIIIILGGFLFTRSNSMLVGIDDIPVSAPDCSLLCIESLVPQFCGSIHNKTCICTSVEFSASLTTCVGTSCNITEALSFQKYAADSCDIVNDKTWNQQQMNLYYILPALTTVFVAARVYARLRLDFGLGSDDLMMLAAAVAYLVDIGAGLILVFNGFGQHTFYLSVSEITTSLRSLYIAQIFYILALTFTKLSLLLFFRRIFPNKAMQHVTLGFGIFIILANSCLVLTACFQCVPFEGNWTNWMYKIPPVKCLDRPLAIFATAGIGIFEDLVILAIPLPILWKLNLAWRKKVNLLVIFSIGLFVVICSILRLSSFNKLLTASTDPSYDEAPVVVWSHLETSIGIICSCLPACCSLVVSFFSSSRVVSQSTVNNFDPSNDFLRSRHRKSTPNIDSLLIHRCDNKDCDCRDGGLKSIKSQDSKSPVDIISAQRNDIEMGLWTKVDENLRGTVD